MAIHRYVAKLLRNQLDFMSVLYHVPDMQLIKSGIIPTGCNNMVDALHRAINEVTEIINGITSKEGTENYRDLSILFGIVAFEDFSKKHKRNFTVYLRLNHPELFENKFVSINSFQSGIIGELVRIVGLEFKQSNTLLSLDSIQSLNFVKSSDIEMDEEIKDFLTNARKSGDVVKFMYNNLHEFTPRQKLAFLVELNIKEFTRVYTAHKGEKPEILKLAMNARISKDYLIWEEDLRG